MSFISLTATKGATNNNIVEVAFSKFGELAMRINAFLFCFITIMDNK
ncbi:hypothetical protein GCM10022410_13290 [Amphibacillus indicireducens]|uniref:Uncharacterized protein n=1 Tax=Amphibacillus indicireducens TaxID=1076330 RepID=A0ABP7VJM1_9BACI